MDKISIITICYNCKEDFRMTAESVFAQSYPDIEYIVIDGDSTDGTKEVIQDHRNHISIFISEKDHGIYDALNKGVSNATGEWILCLNAGDRLVDEHVLMNLFSRTDLDTYSVLYSDCLVEHGNGIISRVTMNRESGDVHHQNAIYRRRLHQQYGMYLVTHPYIISDLLFLLSIPTSLYLKIDTPIAYSKEGGISCALWSGEQAIGLKIAHGLESMPKGFAEYVKLRYNLWKGKIKKNIKEVLWK